MLDLNNPAGGDDAISENLHTESGTPKDGILPQDTDLAYLADLWPGLSEHVRAAVLALVRIIPDKEQAL
jgi:hypothetical protein